MQDTALAEIRDMFDRLDSLITFTVIRFIYSICKLYLSDAETVVLCVITSMFLLLVPTPAAHGDSALKSIYNSLQNVTLMVLSQAAVTSLGVGAMTVYTADVPVETVMLSIADVTCVLVLASVVAELGTSVLVSRCVTILLYIYADAIESLFRANSGGILPTLVCILAYMCMHAYTSLSKNLFTAQYLLRAMNMVTVNFMLKALVDINRDSSNLYVDTVLYTLVLFLIDVLSFVSVMFAETRDYAVWRVSQQLFLVYQAYQVDAIVALSFCCILLMSRTLWPTSKSMQLVQHVVVLVVISVFMDTATGYIKTQASVQSAVLLLAYVVFMHQATSVLQGS